MEIFKQAGERRNRFQKAKYELNIDNEAPLNEHELSMIKLLMY